MVLYPWPHFLPVNRRKSRSNLFSIFKRWISYWHSSIVVYPFPLGRPLRFCGSPAAKRACSRLYRLIQFLICTFSNPNASAISCRVRPSFRIFMISVSTALIAHEICKDVPLNLHAHQFRHAKASHWLEDGMNILQISFLLGHEQLQTTMIYMDITTEDEVQALATLEDENDKKVSPKWKKADGSLMDFCGIPRKK